MTQPKIGIAITADDKTAAGLKSAEKRVGGSVKKLGREVDKASAGLGRGGQSLLSTFSRVEQATSRMLGGKSFTSGITGKLGQLGEVAGEARLGMAGAAEAGGLLEGSLLGLGGAAAGVVGVVGAVAVGMYKLADGWGKGANQLGNMASLLGVSTKGLQEFAGAAERVGVSKETATSAIGSLSQNLNDARYGRNNQVLAILGKMGVKLQTKDDGTVDVDAMIPAIATALQAQNSSGRRTAAKALGVEAALPAFTQGAKALGADMADYGRNGAMMTDDDTKLGRQLTHRDVSGEQRLGKVWLGVQRGNANLVKGAGDYAIGAYNSLTGEGGGDDEARPTTGGALGLAGSGSTISRPGLTPEAIAAAQRSEAKWGIPASILLAHYKVESGMGRHMPAGSNNPFGIKARKDEPGVWAMTTEIEHGARVRKQQRFRQFASLDDSFDGLGELLARRSPYAHARAALPDINEYMRREGERYAPGAGYAKMMIPAERGFRQYDRAEPVPVRVDVHLHGSRAGDRVEVQAGHGKRPAISNASHLD